ncbi:hypothetical protein CL656_02630 [bacterium]|nr:hypothetical protein [bacterium]
MNEKILAPRLEPSIEIDEIEISDCSHLNTVCVYSDALEMLSDDNIKNVLEFASEVCRDVIDSVKTLDHAEETIPVLESSSELVNLEEDVLEREYTQEQILERRQELLQKRKRFVQIVLDAIYVRYQTEIDALIALEPRWQSLLDSKFERVQRWGTARFIKQIVRDDKKLTELLKINVDIDGSKKAKKQIKDLPYIKSFLARCRVGEDRLIGGGYLKGDEKGEIVARRFQKIKDALEDFRIEVFQDYKIVDGKKRTYKKGVNGKKISLKNELTNLNLRNEIVEASLSISDLESFRVWLKTNLRLEQVSVKNSDENILFCVFVSSLRKIVGKKILPTSIDTIELYKRLLNERFISKTLISSPFKIYALDTTFIEYRDILWESYLNTSDFFAIYPSYYFWLKNAPEARDLKNINLGYVWGMIPYDFRDKWSYINLPFEDADKLHNAFEEVQNSWNGNANAKEQFFRDYPSYYFWLKNAQEAKDLKKSNLGQVWGMIPDEFRDQWSNINLPFKDADKLYVEILEDSKTWINGDSRAYLHHFAQTNLCFSEYWGLIPTSLRQKFNLEYYHPGKIDYNGIKVYSKQEFAVLRVFEDVLDYQPEVGVNFQVEVNSNTRHTFDFKIEYQENDIHVTHFFEWHPVVVSFNGGRNDAGTLDEYQDIVELIDDDYLTDTELNILTQEAVEKDYYNERLELLTNKTSKFLRVDVCLTCATGGLTKNLETLHGFLKQAKPDLELTLAQLTLMFKGYLNDAKGYEVESVN